MDSAFDILSFDYILSLSIIACVKNEVDKYIFDGNLCIIRSTYEVSFRFNKSIVKIDYFS